MIYSLNDVRPASTTEHTVLYEKETDRVRLRVSGLADALPQRHAGSRCRCRRSSEGESVPGRAATHRLAGHFSHSPSSTIESRPEEATPPSFCLGLAFVWLADASALRWGLQLSTGFRRRRTILSSFRARSDLV